MSVSEPSLHFGVLGGLELRRGGVPVDLGPYKQRLLLATLLSHANKAVSVDCLMEAVWDDAPPRTARKNLQAYVSMLRKLVGPRLGHVAYGYLLTCTSEESDLLRFEELARAGRQALRDGSPTRAAAALADALAQWRGPFLADLPRGSLLEAEAVRLAERRLRVGEDWAEVAVGLGQYRDVLEGLDGFADGHWERERLTVARLTALYQCGRRQEALAHYESVRTALARDLGLDPSPVLQRLFQSMLAGQPLGPTPPVIAPPVVAPPVIASPVAAPTGFDSTGVVSAEFVSTVGARMVPAGAVAPTVAAPTTADPAVADPAVADPTAATTGRTALTPVGAGSPPGAEPGGPPLAGTLPRDTADFIGREREIGRIVEVLGPGGDDSRIALITGPVGSGKTALAIHVAYLAGHRFPDGELFLPLRDERSRPRTLRQLLASAGAAVGLDFGDLDTAEAMQRWRRWLSGRRILLVLDDARDESVVRGLLPGRGASRALVTSRYRLSGLDSTLRIEVGELGRVEAVELTAKIAGFGLVLAERDEVASYIAHCGRSPLAIRILAGRLRQLTGPPLRPDGDLLEQLVLGDLSLASRYEQHCADLPAPYRQVLAALVSGARPPFDRVVITKLVEQEPAEVDRAIEALVEANLLLRTDDDEVTAHADTYAMPALAYEYARSRL